MMKNLLLIAFLTISALPTMAQVELNVGYGYGRAQGQMLRNFQDVHGFNLGGGYRFGGLPISVGVDIYWGSYGYQSQRQTYTFSDGSTTETNVNVTNAVFNAMAYSRLYYPNQSIIEPYLQVRGGLSNFYTSLTIEDPQDVDGCKPLESNILKGSKALAGNVGVGMRIKLGKDSPSAIDFTASYMLGGRVDYMSLNATAPQATYNSEVSASFINVQHQVVHKHHVGYVYSSPIRMLDFRLTYSHSF